MSFFPLLVLFFSAFTARADLERVYVEALIKLHRGKVSSAYDEFETVSRKNDDFLLSLVELQKLHYKQQEWSKFFAYSVFYRKVYLNDSAQWKDNFKARVFTLEALALGKHCLWDQAYFILSQGIEIAKQLNSPDLEELEHALIFFPSLKSYTHPSLKAQENKHIPTAFFRDTNYWPIDFKNNLLNQIPHPRVLRLKVESRCEK